MHAPHHLESVSRRFSAGAAAYARHTLAQRDAAAHLLNLIPQHSFKSILEPGCGTGSFTRLLHARWPQARIAAVDAAPGMIAAARDTWQGGGEVCWSVADATAPDDGMAFDLIASNCALHWSLDLPGAFQRLARTLLPGGVLAASLMLRGTLGELHEARLAAAPHKRPRAQLPSRELTETALWQAGLTVLQVEEETLHTRVPSARALLRALHEQGVTGGWISQADRPLTRGELTRLCEIYDAGPSSTDDGVRATYRIGYFVAERL